MKSSEDLIIDFYDKVLEEESVSSLSDFQRFAFYIVSIRCSIDIGGFSSIYEQLVPKSEFANIVSCFNQIGESKQANAFQKLYEILENSNFFESFSIQETDFDCLQDIEEIICADDYLWDLDSKLAELIEN